MRRRTSAGDEPWTSDGTAAGSGLLQPHRRRPALAGDHSRASRWNGSCSSAPTTASHGIGALAQRRDRGRHVARRGPGPGRRTRLVPERLHGRTSGVLYFHALGRRRDARRRSGAPTAPPRARCACHGPGHPLLDVGRLRRARAPRSSSAAATTRTEAELWKSDGTSAGTVLVRDMAPGPLGIGPEQLTRRERQRCSSRRTTRPKATRCGRATAPRRERSASTIVQPGSGSSVHRRPRRRRRPAVLRRRTTACTAPSPG